MDSSRINVASEDWDIYPRGMKSSSSWIVFTLRRGMGFVQSHSAHVHIPKHLETNNRAEELPKISKVSRVSGGHSQCALCEEHIGNDQSMHPMDKWNKHSRFQMKIT